MKRNLELNIGDVPAVIINPIPSNDIVVRAEVLECLPPASRGNVSNGKLPLVENRDELHEIIEGQDTTCCPIPLCKLEGAQIVERAKLREGGRELG